MKCNFCGREVPRGTQECPYCHYRFEIEATVLNPQERDEFEGVTIDESGYEETAAKDERRPEQRARYERREEYSNKNGSGPKIYVKNLNGCGGGLYASVYRSRCHRRCVLFNQQHSGRVLKIGKKELHFPICFGRKASAVLF